MAGGAPCLERSNRRIIEPAKTAAELKIVRIEAALKDETTGLNRREVSPKTDPGTTTHKEIRKSLHFPRPLLHASLRARRSLVSTASRP